MRPGRTSDDRYINGITPWVDVAAVNAAIVPSRRYKGLTVLIGVEEFWYRDGIANADLISKGSSEDIVVTGRGIWKYDAVITIAPAEGKVRFDSLTIGSIANIYLAQITDDFADAGNLIETLAPGDTIFIQQRDDATCWLRLLITGDPVDGGTWWTIPAAISESGGTLPDVDAQVIVKFTPSGGVVENHFKGTYDDLAALETAFPEAEPGDYALVDEAGVIHCFTFGMKPIVSGL